MIYLKILKKLKTSTPCPRLEPVQEKSGDSYNLGSQGKKVARDKTAVIRRRNISTVTKRTNEESVEIENANNFELLKNKMFLNTFLNRPQDQDLSSSSEEETEDFKNPMFPSHHNRELSQT